MTVMPWRTPMPNPDPAAQVLAVARRGTTAYVRVTGMATLAVAGALKQFGLSALERGCARLVVDTAACATMDSTVLGVLAGLAARLARIPGGALVLLNVPPTLAGILTTLGLDQVVACEPLGAAAGSPAAAPADPALRPLAPEPAAAAATRDLMIEAHTALADLSPANALRFQDVLTYLKEDPAATGAGREG